MGCGALVADRQKQWPTSFDFSNTYLHLDELFLHDAPVEYENNDGEVVRLSQGQTPGKLDFTLNDIAKGDVTELRFERVAGGLACKTTCPSGRQWIAGA